MKPDISYKTVKKVETYIKKYDMIRHGECVVIGLSGGADSVCLFLILNRLKDILKFELRAMHLNHGIRGESSSRDEDFSRSLCEKHNIPFVSYYVDVPAVAKETGLTLEEAGRNVRYALFKNIANELNREIKIAVAHHQNDQAETVIFNMIRGSGIKGMGGMSPISARTFTKSSKDDKITLLKVIRPLLCLTRDEIEEYLKFMDEDYCIDETNLDNDYSRNQIRNNVLPELTDIQNKSVEHISLMAEEAREMVEYMDREVAKLFDKTVSTEPYGDLTVYKMAVKPLKDESSIIVRYLIIYVLKQIIINYKDITRTHIEDVYSLFFKGKGKYVTLPYGLIALRDKEFVEIKEKPV